MRSNKQCCSYQDLACHCGDDPRTGWTTWSAVSNAVPTLRRSSGLIVSPCMNRQFLLKELYCGMGFAVWPFLAESAKVPVFDVFRPGVWTYPQARQALGNAQHVTCVGTFVACALSSSSWLQQGN